MTRDAKQVVFATDEGWILFMETETHAFINGHKLDGEPVSHIVATSNHRHVVTAGGKQDIIVWDPTTGK